MAGTFAPESAPAARAAPAALRAQPLLVVSDLQGDPEDHGEAKGAEGELSDPALTACVCVWVWVCVV